ncbi:ATP synthase F1 subunit gamma [Buchnera aphidicola (Takecallis taiwana)]|uniref:ATP synthase F1 subunit gamma n=1 Tax=Buchnera aphidicola TaxID=9 RepID=UPI0031B6838A
MANTKTIRNKISSIKNTQKITKTMEMVAISKMKKVKKKLLISSPYLENIKKIISHFFHGKLSYKHCFLHKENITKKIGIIIISSNRGLCGNLNYNVFKQVNNFIAIHKKKNISCNLYLLGSKAILFFNNSYYSNVKKTMYYNDDIKHDTLLPLINELIQEYQTDGFDQLFIAGNKFHTQNNKMSYILQLLPLQSILFMDKKYTKYTMWDYLYEPNSSIVLDYTLQKYILLQVFQVILENIVCEQYSRRLIMKTATDNSENIIQELQLLYNKIRQYSITQEIMEIVSGASSIN